ncbi:UNVERIFIED_CONTAM: hypothetical protein K2H54_058206 [Gekko kuhli]
MKFPNNLGQNILLYHTQTICVTAVKNVIACHKMQLMHMIQHYLQSCKNQLQIFMMIILLIIRGVYIALLHSHSIGVLILLHFKQTKKANTILCTHVLFFCLPSFNKGYPFLVSTTCAGRRDCTTGTEERTC